MQVETSLREPHFLDSAFGEADVKCFPRSNNQYVFGFCGFRAWHLMQRKLLKLHSQIRSSQSRQMKIIQSWREAEDGHKEHLCQDDKKCTHGVRKPLHQ